MKYVALFFIAWSLGFGGYAVLHIVNGGYGWSTIVAVVIHPLAITYWAYRLRREWIAS